MTKGGKNAASEPIEAGIRLCTSHDTRMYPHVLALETVVHLNKKVCYICASQFMNQGHIVKCRISMTSEGGQKLLTSIHNLWRSSMRHRISSTRDF